MSKDPYIVLGVTRSVDAEGIRAAYKRLAKQHHPDRNPGNAKAEETFKNISAAYALLNDVEKRRRFDAGEIDADGQERAPDFGGFRSGGAGTGDFTDIFENFGFRGSPRGSDYRYSLEIDFLEAVRGGKKRVTLAGGAMVDINVPVGTLDGLELRLPGRGAEGQGRGAAPGDAIVELRVRPHPVFTREGDDILIELPITLDEAVLGGKVEVPTIDGPVALSIPPGSSSGAVLRMQRRGVRRGALTGNQLVKLRIVLPGKIDDELANFITEWRKAHAYDPRAKLKASV